MPHLTQARQPVPFARTLAAHGTRPAVVTADGVINYRELASRVTRFKHRLGDQPRLILLAGENTVETLVAYLAALAGGHPVLLAPGDRPEAVATLAAAYDPDLLVESGQLTERRAHTIHKLHPELALLLSTSGSTGAAKLVRLSAANLQSNAEAIADYLDIDATERAATTLPMHYCYGLSVLHSHLLRGASVLLTSRSVTEPEFWQEFREHRATSFAGVPYTFDLLDRVGFETMSLPRLRYVTQAGGRLAPARVRRYAALARRGGWRLFVMYGQTEATARIAYLPPELADARPGSIGRPIPGGSIRLEPVARWPEPDAGELVYTGPNVMLGYASDPADLADGRTVHELRTGDIARRAPDGLYEIIGRRARFGKVFGVRVDLDQVEARLAGQGLATGCVSDDQHLLVAVAAGDGQPGRVRRLAARASGLPQSAVRVAVLPALPRLTSGKLDYPALTAAAARTIAAPAGAAATEVDLRLLYAEVLGVDRVTEDDSFVSLGGDSLSYVAMSVRLERVLGRLPERWHESPIRQLQRRAEPPRRRLRLAWLETSVALRAVSIALIVGTHTTLFGVAGGAHLLLGVAGFNYARFLLGEAPYRLRLRRQARGIGRLAGASMAWIAMVWLFTDEYALANVFLLHYVVGPGSAVHDWHFWFIEALVYIQLGAFALLAIPVVDRLERRWPYALPLTLALAGLVTRYQLVPGVTLATPAEIAWLFALGWAAARASTRGQRLLVSVIVVATVPGLFADPRRELVIAAGMLLLIWVRWLPSLSGLNSVVAVLAGASLYIYLTHWQVYPHLYGSSPLLATVASLAVGIGYGLLVKRLTGWLAPALRRDWMGRWQTST